MNAFVLLQQELQGKMKKSKNLSSFKGSLVKSNSIKGLDLRWYSHISVELRPDCFRVR